MKVISLLVERGVVVICGGGGGIPVEAATRFVATTGHPAAIGRLEDAAAMLRGDAGTKIEPVGADIEIRH